MDRNSVMSGPPVAAGTEPDGNGLASTSVTPSLVGGVTFTLRREGPSVTITRSSPGGSPSHELSVHFADEGAEASLRTWLSRMPVAYRTGEQRDLEAARLIAEARRLALTTGTNGDHGPEHRATELLESPDLIDTLRDDLVKVGFRTDPEVGLTLYLCKISALLAEPVYVYLTGPACSLKTTYADLVALLTPPEMRKHLTDLTPKALYQGDAHLEHFVISLDEMDLRGKGLALDQKVLRMLFSKGWCEIEVARGTTSIRRHVRGPVQVTQTTTAVRFDEQDSSRHLLIELPDTPERTDTVLTMMGEQYAGICDQSDTGLIIETHRLIHRLLPCGTRVDVPFAPAIEKLLPRDQITVLRAFRTLISLVRASALLHLRQRECDEFGHIKASIDDYRLVYRVAGTFIAHSLVSGQAPAATQRWVEGLLSQITQRALDRADAGESQERAALLRLGREEFISTRRRWTEPLMLDELVDLSRRPRTTAQRHLDQLIQAGLIDREKVGRAFAYRLATSDGHLPNCPQLPSPEEVERGHMGTFRNSLWRKDFNCPGEGGQITNRRIAL